jgi:hypothetical protein
LKVQIGAAVVVDVVDVVEVVDVDVDVVDVVDVTFIQSTIVFLVV